MGSRRWLGALQLEDEMLMRPTPGAGVTDSSPSWIS